MTNEIASGPWAGFEVIHRYTRAQAIDDGVLVDVTTQARAYGYTVHTAMTATLFAACEQTAAARAAAKSEPDVEQYVRRVLCLAADAVRTLRRAGTDGADRVTFSLTCLAGTPTKALLHIGPGDDAAPVVTLMYPGEE